MVCCHPPRARYERVCDASPSIRWPASRLVSKANRVPKDPRDFKNMEELREHLHQGRSGPTMLSVFNWLSQGVEPAIGEVPEVAAMLEL
jgi:hypothetical protein